MKLMFIFSLIVLISCSHIERAPSSKKIVPTNDCIYHSVKLLDSINAEDNSNSIYSNVEKYRKIFKTKKQVIAYLEKNVSPDNKFIFPTDENQKLALLIRFSESFGGEGFEKFSSSKTMQKVLQKINIETKEFSSDGAELNIAKILNISDQLFDAVNPSPYKFKQILTTRFGKLKKELKYRYLYNSIVRNDIKTALERTLYSNTTPVKTIHAAFKNRGFIKRNIKSVFKTAKLFFGLGRTPTYLRKIAIPDEFIDLVEIKGLKHAFDMHGDLIFKDLKWHANKEIIWVYTSTAYVAFWLSQLTGILYIASTTDLTFGDPNADENYPREKNLKYMMKAWQQEKVMATGILFGENTKEYKKAKILFEKTTGEDFKENYRNFYKQYKDKILSKDELKKKFEISISSREVRNIKKELMDIWIKINKERGIIVEPEGADYKMRQKSYDKMFPKELVETHKKYTTLPLFESKEVLVEKIMQQWLKVNNENSDEKIDSNSELYIAAFEFYSSKSKIELQDIILSLDLN